MSHDPEATICRCERQIDDIEKRFTSERQEAGVQIIGNELTGIQNRLRDLKNVALSDELRNRRTKASGRCDELSADVNEQLADFEKDWNARPDHPTPQTP